MSLDVTVRNPMPKIEAHIGAQKAEPPRPQRVPWQTR